ncbi:MAG: hypothetical protein L3J24_05810 [Xanthomonadales bacterium]|nr:hypothetical protein [Xanthomonadales bacterium]
MLGSCLRGNDECGEWGRRSVGVESGRVLMLEMVGDDINNVLGFVKALVSYVRGYFSEVLT